MTNIEKWELKQASQTLLKSAVRFAWEHLEPEMQPAKNFEYVYPRTTTDVVANPNVLEGSLSYTSREALSTQIYVVIKAEFSKLPKKILAWLLSSSRC